MISRRISTVSVDFIRVNPFPVLIFSMMSDLVRAMESAPFGEIDFNCMYFVILTIMDSFWQEIKHVNGCLFARGFAIKAMMFELGPNSDQSDLSKVFDGNDILRDWLDIWINGPIACSP